MKCAAAKIVIGAAVAPTEGARVPAPVQASEPTLNFDQARQGNLAIAHELARQIGARLDVAAGRTRMRRVRRA